MNRRRRRLCLAAASLAATTTAWPQRATTRLGYLSAREARSDIDDAFVRRMDELGYTVGRNLAIEYRFAGNDAARLKTMAEELARMPVDVIVTATTAGTRAAMAATRTLPIVMAATADPVATGLVASLARPGGNVTGLSLQTPDVASKRLQLTREIVPGAARIALLAEKTASPTQGTTASLVAESAAAAKTLGVTLIVREVHAAQALHEAFDAFRRENAQALIVQVSPLLVEHRATIVALASRNRLPAIYEARNFVDAGGLASYGPDLRATYRRAADYVDRILRGARPADLPVEQPERIALVVNVSAAKALGMTLPDAVMLQAETVSRPLPR